jgi:hypothetical protein
MTIAKQHAVVALLAGVMVLAACGHAQKPAESEFGLGPRKSTQGYFVATLQSPDPLRVRKMQTVQVAIQDAYGKAIDGATITVDGGMPEHGHGLPTQPRVTKNLGNGVYQIEGVRFNMGGWWEFKLAVTTPTATDNITFNIQL